MEMIVARKQNSLTRKIFIFLFIWSCISFGEDTGNKKSENLHPRIVNIVNFVRLLEPRGVILTQDVLFQTTVNQLNMMKAHNLGGTFLLQYDALMDSRYQKLLKNLSSEYEVGAWFEIPQPLVEKAGLKWRGRYPWDWRANIGFLIAYTIEEREKLIDVYMEDFKKIFGSYPKSVGCWFIDARSLEYMYMKYGITASCNCRDQIGVDGYTLWGGYWNQAYYPSKVNSYMPAQNFKNQIPVPIFRMLGSDPLRMTNPTGMEPAIKDDGGGDSSYVDWYFNEFLNGASMDFAYVQIGQENSFGWNRMSKGFTYQIKLIAQLRDEGKVHVETLSETGAWFKRKYKTTPSTSVTVLNGMKEDNRKTVWFDSRFYRANILWENGTIRFRDIHLFDEKLKCQYLTDINSSTAAKFFTLPFVDCLSFGRNENNPTGLLLKAIVNGKEILLEGETPVVDDSKKNQLHISSKLKNVNGVFIIEMNERGIQMKLRSNTVINWYFDFTTSEDTRPSIKKISAHNIECRFKDFDYHVDIIKGSVTVPGKEIVYRLTPENGNLSINFSKR
jgi:hypothetical protein